MVCRQHTLLAYYQLLLQRILLVTTYQCERQYELLIPFRERGSMLLGWATIYCGRLQEQQSEDELAQSCEVASVFSRNISIRLDKPQKTLLPYGGS